MAEKESGLSSIGRISVPVTDLNRAVGFHRDTLKMRFLISGAAGPGVL